MCDIVLSVRLKHPNSYTQTYLIQNKEYQIKAEII